MAKKTAKKVEGEAPEKVEKKSKKVEEVEVVSVLDKDGVFIRTYSVADHGENFQELAEQFRKKIKGTVEEGDLS